MSEQAIGAKTNRREVLKWSGTGVLGGMAASTRHRDPPHPY